MNIRISNFLKQQDDYSLRGIFGGVGIFYDEKMAAIVYKERIFVRNIEESEYSQIREICPTYVQKKIKHNVGLNYFDMTDYLETYASSYWMKLAIQAARIEAKVEKDNKVLNDMNLREMTNIVFKLERMLQKIDTTKISHLHEMGAEKTYLKLKEYYPYITIDILWKLLGAIRNEHYLLLSQAVKEDSLEKLKALEQEIIVESKEKIRLLANLRKKDTDENE